MVKVKVESYNELEEMLSKAEQKPRAIVLYGKHEPVEPTSAIVDKMHNDSKDVWFVKHPYLCTSTGYLNTQYKCLDDFISTLEKGEIPDINIERSRSTRNSYWALTRLTSEQIVLVGKALRNGLEEFKESYHRYYNGKKAKEPSLLYRWSTNLGKIADKHGIRMNSCKIKEMSHEFKDLCYAMRSHVRNVTPEMELARRLREISPESEIVALHCTPIESDEEHMVKKQWLLLLTDDPAKSKDNTAYNYTKDFAKREKHVAICKHLYKTTNALYSTIVEVLHSEDLLEHRAPFKKEWKIEAVEQILKPKEKVVLPSGGLRFMSQVDPEYARWAPKFSNKMLVEYAHVLDKYLKDLNKD